MSLSKPLSDGAAEHEGSASSWWLWADGVQAVGSWGEQLHLGAKELRKSLIEVKLAAPVIELGEDVVDFSISIGRGIASFYCEAAPFAELGADLVAEVNGLATRTRNGLERQSGLMISSGKSSLLTNGCSAISSKGEATLGDKDGVVLSLLIAGLLAPTPSGVMILASAGPAFSLKAAFGVVGSAMFWKCWMIYTRDDDGFPPDERPRKDLTMAITGISGIVNLGLAFGGLPALLKLGGMSLHLTQYVVHPDVFVHFLADIVLNPMLLLDMAYTSKVTRVSAVALVTPSMIASALGACCMVGTSMAVSPVVFYSLLGVNVCCVTFQNWDLQVAFPRKVENSPNELRLRQTCDAYVFASGLYMVPAIMAVLMPSKSAVAVLPAIDLLGKMGVIQLTWKAKEEDNGPKAQR